MEKVNKISNPLNYINKVFKAEKPNAQIHLAYALSNFLIYPCQTFRIFPLFIPYLIIEMLFCLA